MYVSVYTGKEFTLECGSFAEYLNICLPKPKHYMFVKTPTLYQYKLRIMFVLNYVFKGH